jgi:hypothetical protein
MSKLMRRHFDVPIANSYSLTMREKSRDVDTMSSQIFLSVCGVDKELWVETNRRL